MDRKETGGPAFPVADPFLLKPGDEKRMMEIAGGMSLRDYFAAKALPALIGLPDPDGTEDAESSASWAYAYADAMLKARDGA